MSRTDVPFFVIASARRRAESSSPPREFEKQTIAIFLFACTIVGGI